ncbi:hypothetical protein P9112_012868 [Eukaryota sp. TZLM1-RC]
MSCSSSKPTSKLINGLLGGQPRRSSLPRSSTLDARIFDPPKKKISDVPLVNTSNHIRSLSTSLPSRPPQPPILPPTSSTSVSDNSSFLNLHSTANTKNTVLEKSSSHYESRHSCSQDSSEHSSSLLSEPPIIFIYTDGSATTIDDNGIAKRLAGCSCQLYIKDKLIFNQYGQVLDKATINSAELSAIILGLLSLLKLKYKPKRVEFFTDSQNVIKWLSGQFNATVNIIKKKVNLIQILLQKLNTQFIFNWVKAHNNDNKMKLQISGLKLVLIPIVLIICLYLTL